MGLVCLLLQLYVFALIARIILSWFPIQPGTAMASIHHFLYRITEPILGPLRRNLPMPRFGGVGIDLSPMIVIFGVFVLQGILCS